MDGRGWEVLSPWMADQPAKPSVAPRGRLFSGWPMAKPRRTCHRFTAFLRRARCGHVEAWETPEDRVACHELESVMADQGDALTFLRCLKDRSEVTDAGFIDLVGVGWPVV